MLILFLVTFWPVTFGYKMILLSSFQNLDTISPGMNFKDCTFAVDGIFALTCPNQGGVWIVDAKSVFDPKNCASCATDSTAPKYSPGFQFCNFYGTTNTKALKLIGRQVSEFFYSEMNSGTQTTSIIFDYVRFLV